MVSLRALLLACVAVVVGCSGSSAEAPVDDGARADEFKADDFPEDTILPYAGDWLDPPKALAGIGQFDRLRGTIHDDAKCSTMVAVAAAIIAGRERFGIFLDAVARLREGRADDLAIIERVRTAVAEKKMTPRHIHELTEAVVRAYKVANGAFDGQIITMVRASGYKPTHVGSKKPQVLIDHMNEGDVVPLGTVADNEAHITLLWKDARGVVRLYDSDDIHGHVLPRGSTAYRVRIEDPQSGWDAGDTYH